MSTPIKPTFVIRLPRLTGTRNRVAPLLDIYSIPHDLTDAHVTLDGYRTLAGTATFADEIVQELLLVRKAIHVFVIRLGLPLQGDFVDAARRHEVTARIQVSSAEFGQLPQPRQAGPARVVGTV